MEDFTHEVVHIRMGHGDTYIQKFKTEEEAKSCKQAWLNAGYNAHIRKARKKKKGAVK